MATMNNLNAAVVATVLVIVAAVIFVVWPTSDRKAERDASAVTLRPGDSDLVATGGRLYSVHCASCHGANLEGQANWRTRRPNGRLPAPPHDETGHSWHHPDKLLFKLTKFGAAALAGGGYKSDMPAFNEVLADEEIVAVLSYIKSRWPARIRERHDGLNSRNR